MAKNGLEKQSRVWPRGFLIVIISVDVKATTSYPRETEGNNEPPEIGVLCLRASIKHSQPRAERPAVTYPITGKHDLPGQ